MDTADLPDIEEEQGQTRKEFSPSHPDTTFGIWRIGCEFVERAKVNVDPSLAQAKGLTVSQVAQQHLHRRDVSGEQGSSPARRYRKSGCKTTDKISGSEKT